MAAGVGAIGIGTSLAGGLLSAFGSKAAGESQQQMYNYQARVAQINANIDRQNRDWALHKGDVEAQQYGMKAGQQFAAIRTAQAASGTDVNTGSNVRVQQSQRAITGIDLAQIRENTAKVAYDYTAKAVMDENQATLDVLAGESSRREGNIKAMSSILGTVGSVSSKWLQGRQAGMWG